MGLTFFPLDQLEKMPSDSPPRAIAITYLFSLLYFEVTLLTAIQCFLRDDP